MPVSIKQLVKLIFYSYFKYITGNLNNYSTMRLNKFF